VGQGSLRANLEGHSRVHLLGVRDDVPEILSASDIFALASDWEGLPLALIEAMAAGLPAVATSVGCVPEVIQHGTTGLLVSPGSDIELVTGLRRLTKDSILRRQMGAAARKCSLSFSLDAMVAAYEDLFHKLLGASVPETV
jgi:glycosyltransferase involved in cell wall biosynthesis